MARTKEQKIKLLSLFDILCKHTDEDHALSTGQIIEMLQEKCIDVSRKVLPDDIALLNEFGYEVLTKKGHPNGYYVVDHTFEPAEITMFSDAVQASKLTEGHKRHCFLCNKEKQFYLQSKQEESKLGNDKVKIARKQYRGQGEYIEDILQ